MDDTISHNHLNNKFSLYDSTKFDKLSKKFEESMQQEEDQEQFISY